MGGIQCSAQQKERLVHFVGRKAFNIDNIGERLITQLVEQKPDFDFPDFFLLTKETLMTLPRMGEKSCQRILDSIDQARQVTFERFIYSLGIPEVGEGTSKRLASHFETLDDFLMTDATTLEAIEDIGPITATSIMLFLGTPRNINCISMLKDYHQAGEGLVTIVYPRPTGDRFKGTTWVITGSFTKDSREALKALIEKEGGKVSGKVTKQTTHLLAGNGGGSKRSDAAKLNVPVIGENDFFEMFS